MEEEKNELLYLNPDNIIFEFHLDEGNDTYIVFSKDTEISDDTIFFAKKREVEDGVCVLDDIDDEEEYKRVVTRYEEILAEVEDEYGE